jgi:hypothetical protein
MNFQNHVFLLIKWDVVFCPYRTFPCLPGQRLILPLPKIQVYSCEQNISIYFEVGYFCKVYAFDEFRQSEWY